MVRKVFIVLVAAVWIGFSSISVQAVQHGGVIRVSLNVGELPVTNGALRLHCVGKSTDQGYRLGEIYGGGIIRKEDADSLYLAQWLAESAGDTGKVINLDVDGNVSFTDLEPGLYLIMQTEPTDGFYPIAPILVAVPGEGEQVIQVYPQTNPIMIENPQTGQPIAPVLGAVGMVVSGAGLYLLVDRKRKTRPFRENCFL